MTLLHAMILIHYATSTEPYAMHDPLRANNRATREYTDELVRSGYLLPENVTPGLRATDKGRALLDLMLSVEDSMVPPIMVSTENFDEAVTCTSFIGQMMESLNTDVNESEAFIETVIVMSLRGLAAMKALSMDIDKNNKAFSSIIRQLTSRLLERDRQLNELIRSIKNDH